MGSGVEGTFATCSAARRLVQHTDVGERPADITRYA